MNSLRCANNYHWQKQLRGSSTNRTIKYSILPIKQANNFNYMHTHIIIYNNRHIQPYSSLSWKLLFAYMNTKIQTMYKMIISTHAHFKQLAKLQWPKQTKSKKKQKKEKEKKNINSKRHIYNITKKKSRPLFGFNGSRRFFRKLVMSLHMRRSLWKEAYGESGVGLGAGEN